MMQCVAKCLLGSFVVNGFGDGIDKRYRITETEAYMDENERGCHATKGRVVRTDAMYAEGGFVYVF